jgi:hypothetical protein
LVEAWDKLKILCSPAGEPNFRLSERSVVFDYKNAWKILALNKIRPANAGRNGEIIFKKSEIEKMRYLLDKIRTHFEENPSADF